MAIPSPPSTTPQDILNLHKAHKFIQEALPLLDGFNHRHKNQHRVAKWWADFGFFRRHVRKLADELPAKIERREKEERLKAKRDAKRSAQDAKSKPASSKGKSDDAVDVRAKWMREDAMPRIYMAFTQVAADNQFAPLGLFLLGVLAQVNATLDDILGIRYKAAETPSVIDATSVHQRRESDDAKAQPSSEKVAPEATKFISPTVAAGEAPGTREEDLGVAIARDDDDEILSTDKTPRKKKSRHSSPAPTNSPRETGGAVGDNVKKAASAKREAGASPAESKPKKKKKTKKSGGDEFDDLFSGLL